MSGVSELINTLFPSGVPRRLASIIDPQLSREALIDFKLNPVLNSNPERTTRLAVVGPSALQNGLRVSKAWNNTAIATFWSAAPPHARRMIDTDGFHTFVVYNDDLQPPPGALLAMTLSLPDTGPVHHSTPSPPKHLTFLPDVSELHSIGGQWALRTEQKPHHRVLWVSESRWKEMRPSRYTQC